MATRSAATCEMGHGKYLIVNADDFGQSSGINDGSVKAFECGIVTSASLMVRWPAAVEAAQYGRAHPALSVGLHVDLGEWANRGGHWEPLYEVASMHDASAVLAEIERQLATFQSLMGRQPTHLDSHQHVHRREPVRSILTEIAARLAVPLRHVNPQVQYCGTFYGQTVDGDSLPEAINSDALIRILGSLSSGWTELICHPAERIDLQTMYTRERLQELETLCREEVRDCVERLQIELCPFHLVQGTPAA